MSDVIASLYSDMTKTKSFSLERFHVSACCHGVEGSAGSVRAAQPASVAGALEDPICHCPGAHTFAAVQYVAFIWRFSHYERVFQCP